MSRACYRNPTLEQIAVRIRDVSAIGVTTGGKLAVLITDRWLALTQSIDSFVSLEPYSEPVRMLDHSTVTKLELHAMLSTLLHQYVAHCLVRRLREQKHCKFCLLASNVNHARCIALNKPMFAGLQLERNTRRHLIAKIKSVHSTFIASPLLTMHDLKLFWNMSCPRNSIEPSVWHTKPGSASHREWIRYACDLANSRLKSC